MKKGTLVTAIILLCTGIFWSLVPVGCANIIPPQGGPRDSLPPRLLHASPPDSSVNFRASRVVLNFGEYIDLKDVQNNLLFTPTFQNNPVIEAKGRSITIRFRDSLERNTTYVMNFGNAIIDLNESNALHDFTYTFSTGAHLDSLELSGRVQLAETGGTDSTLIAILHRHLDDSAVVKERPLYVVRLDRNGRFRFRNLPADTFALYILGDAGFSRRYQNKTQLFAFTNRPVIAGKTDSLLLYAYRETPAVAPAGGVAAGPAQRTAANDRRLRFTAAQGQQDLLNDYVLNFPVPLRTFDSSKLHLSSDSIFTTAPFTTTLDTSKKELHIRSAWKEGTKYNLVLEKEFGTDTSGHQLLKTDTLFFTTRKKADYGQLNITIRNLDTARNPILLFVQNNAVVFSTPIKSGRFQRDLFLPGDYDLRILYDTNGNGKWDPGHFFGTRRQPEIVEPLGDKITVKTNWENEFNITH
jgi:hypothetical protein